MLPALLMAGTTVPKPSSVAPLEMLIPLGLGMLPPARLICPPASVMVDAASTPPTPVEPEVCRKAPPEVRVAALPTKMLAVLSTVPVTDSSAWWAPPNKSMAPELSTASATSVTLAFRLPEGGPTVMALVLVRVPATVRVEPPSAEKASPSSSSAPALRKLPVRPTLAPLMMRSVPSFSARPVRALSGRGGRGVSEHCVRAVEFERNAAGDGADLAAAVLQQRVAEQ